MKAVAVYCPVTVYDRQYGLFPKAPQELKKCYSVVNWNWKTKQNQDELFRNFLQIHKLTQKHKFKNVLDRFPLWLISLSTLWLLLDSEICTSDSLFKSFIGLSELSVLCACCAGEEMRFYWPVSSEKKTTMCAAHFRQKGYVPSNMIPDGMQKPEPRQINGR